MIDKMFGNRAAEFWLSCWPVAQRPLSGSGLHERLGYVFVPELTGSLDTLLEAHDGPIRARSLDARGHLQTSAGVDAATANELLVYGIPVQLRDVDRSFAMLDLVGLELLGDLGIPLSKRVSTIFVLPAGRRVAEPPADLDWWMVGLRGRVTIRVAASDGAEVPAERVDLAPGDTLFVPRGYWRETLAEDELSWFLGIGISRPTHGSLCCAAIRDRLGNEPHLRTRFQGSAEATRRDALAGVQKAIDAVRSALAELSGEDVLDRYRMRVYRRKFRSIPGRSLRIDRDEHLASVFKGEELLVEIDIGPEAMPAFERVVALRGLVTPSSLMEGGPDVTAAMVAGAIAALIEAGYLETITGGD